MPLNIPDYHTTEQILHVNCEPPRAYFIPYAGKCAALGENRDASPYFKSLCGVWDFKFFKSVHDICDFTCGCFDRAAMEKLPVPMNWQMALDRRQVRHRGRGGAHLPRPLHRHLRLLVSDP